MGSSHELTTVLSSNTSTTSPTSADRATISKSLQIKGEVICSESLYVEGTVEGAIYLPERRVTVGRGARVSANITAGEVVVLGKVLGNIFASDRVDIRSEGSLTGCNCAAHQYWRRCLLQGGHRRLQTGPGKRWDGGCRNLHAMSCFYNYSFGNILEIARQRAVTYCYTSLESMNIRGCASLETRYGRHVAVRTNLMDLADRKQITHD
jgi:cytoskeletal protein CcmA (bactofilin family)